MARPKTAQPNHSLRKVAAVVATAVSGMSVYAQAAEQLGISVKSVDNALQRARRKLHSEGVLQ